MTQKPQWSKLRVEKGWAVFAAVLLVFTTAILGTSLEDFTNAWFWWGGDGPRNGWKWRAILLVILAVVWLFAIIKLSRVKSSTGTLYFLRLQEEWHVPVHDPALKLTSVDARDFRAVRRVYRTLTENDERIDLANLADTVVTELERSTNDDDDSTLFAIAPDLPWPAAIRVGYDWSPRKNTRLRELDDQNPNERIEWHLGVELLERQQDSSALVKNPQLRFRQVQPEFTGDDSDEHDGPIARTPDPAVRRVLLAISLTTSDAAMDDNAFAAFAPGYELVRECYTVNPTTSARAKARIISEENSTDSASDHAHAANTAANGDRISIPGNDQSIACLKFIHDAFTMYPEAQIDIVSRIPKTVAFALGSHLASMPLPGTVRCTAKVPKSADSSEDEDWCPGSGSPLHRGDHEFSRGSLPQFWNRCNLLHFDRPRQRYLPMIVHPIQRERPEQG